MSRIADVKNSYLYGMLFMKCMIVGCQRSGTTLLRHVLNAGSLFMFEESWVAAYLYRERFHANGWRSQGYDYEDENTNIWDEKSKQFLFDTYQSYFLRDKSPRHKVWGMKSPGYNMACSIPYLAKLFVDLKFVYLVRDPRDTFSSMSQSEKMMGNLPRHYYVDSINSPDLVNLSQHPYEYWSDVNREILTHRREMPGRFYTLKFEDWMMDPLANTKLICDFLDLSFDRGMLEPFTRNISQSSVISMSKSDFESGKTTLHKTAVDRWKNDLSFDQVKEVMKYSADISVKFGYV